MGSCIVRSWGGQDDNYYSILTIYLPQANIGNMHMCECFVYSWLGTSQQSDAVGQMNEPE